jgi:hypothetical protein
MWATMAARSSVRDRALDLQEEGVLVTKASTTVCAHELLQHNSKGKRNNCALIGKIVPLSMAACGEIQALRSAHERGLGGSCLWEVVERGMWALDLQICAPRRQETQSSQGLR